MKDEHTATITGYPDELIDTIIADLSKRNLRNQRDHEIRWLADRCSALRHERKRRRTTDKNHWSANARPGAVACQN